MERNFLGSAEVEFHAIMLALSFWGWIVQKKFKVVTLGCRTNQYESQAYVDQLKAMGYVEVQEGETADLCIVNTCTVTESADSSSRYQIRQIAREHTGSQLVVTGCLAERQPGEIGKIEGVTHVVPNAKKEQLLTQIFPDEPLPEFSIKQFDHHTRAFVKVQDGCNSFCTYCIIPYVRGRSRSRKLAEILQEVKGLVANGYREIVLTGINIGDFDGGVEKGEDPIRLADLVRAVDQVEGVERLRLSSIDPDEVDLDLQNAILHGRSTCHSLHIVLQSGSNAILKRMNRKYTKQIFLETIERLRAADPLFGFTTDVIVGFPGETEADFEDTLEVMRRVQFAKVHMFPYSKRERTRAALYPNQVAQEVIHQRKQEVLRLAEQCAFTLRESLLGQKVKVLLEGELSSNPLFLSGHTEHFLQVLIPKDGWKSNDLVEVLLIENRPDGLVGRVVP